MKKRLLFSLFLGISLNAQASINAVDNFQHYPVKSVIKQLNKKGWNKSVIALQNPDDFGMKSLSITYTLPPINSQTLFTRFNGQKVLVRNNSIIIKMNGKTLKRKFAKVYSAPNSYDWVGYYNYNNGNKEIVTNQTPIPQTATVGSSQLMYQGKSTEYGQLSSTFTGRWELKPSTNDTSTAQLCLYHHRVPATDSIEDQTTEDQSFCYTIDPQGNILDETIEIISYSQDKDELPMVFKSIGD